MTQFVIGVATEIQPRLHFKTNGDFGIGIHAANHQNDGMKEDKRVEHGCQRVTLHGGEQQWHNNNDRRHFHQPGQFLGGTKAGVDKDQRQHYSASVQDYRIQCAEHGEFTSNGKYYYSL